MHIAGLFRIIPADVGRKICLDRPVQVDSKQKRVTTIGFSLMEAMVGTAVLGMALIPLLGGISFCLDWVREARENLRATQVMIEKVEVIRLLTWDQLNTPGFIPTTFEAPYEPGRTNGTTYKGTITITKMVDANKNYADQLALVSVKINWKSRGPQRQRELITYHGRYGIQNYVIN